MELLVHLIISRVRLLKHWVEPPGDNIKMIDMSLKKPAQHLIIFLAALSSALCSAQVYRTTDEHGNIKFTDRPHPNTEARRVNIGPTNTVRSVEIPTEETSPLEVLDEQAVYYTELKIVSPVNDTAFPNRLLPTPVVLQIRPELKPGHTLHLLLDGIEVSSGSSTELEIPTLNRGTQSLSIELMAGDEILVKSEAITIHAFQPGGSN